MQAGRPVSLLLIDIDHFKSFNDRFGHASGDIVLLRIVRDIMATVGAHDVVFRFGGEEFVVISDGLPRAPALALGERVRRRSPATSMPRRRSSPSASGLPPAPTTPPTMTACSPAPTGGLYGEIGRTKLRGRRERRHGRRLAAASLGRLERNCFIWNQLSL